MRADVWWFVLFPPVLLLSLKQISKSGPGKSSCNRLRGSEDQFSQTLCLPGSGSHKTLGKLCSKVKSEPVDTFLCRACWNNWKSKQRLCSESRRQSSDGTQNSTSSLLTTHRSQAQQCLSSNFLSKLRGPGLSSTQIKAPCACAHPHGRPPVALTAPFRNDLSLIGCWLTEPSPIGHHQAWAVRGSNFYDKRRTEGTETESE